MKMFKFLSCLLAASVMATVANAALINEFQPNPTGGDPANVDIELLGDPGASFDGYILSFEGDSTSSTGLLDRAAAVSGIFDSNGLLVVSIPDLENPTFTIALVDNTFTGVVGTTDIDADNDGTADTLGDLGVILDAIGSPDNVGDQTFLYGADLGGTDLVYTGDEPKLTFRDGVNPANIYSINDPAGTDAIDQDGNLIAFAAFNFDPEAPTFGSVNPTVPEPATVLLVLFGLCISSALGMRVRLG